MKFRRTTLFTAFSVAVVVGIASSRAGWSVSLMQCGVVGLLAVVTLRRRSWAALMTLVLFGALIGNWRGAQQLVQLEPLNDLYDQQVTIRATAQTDGLYAQNSQLSFDVGDISITEPYTVKIPGKLKIEGFGANAVYRGDEIVAEGKLRDTLGSRQGRVSYADISVLGRSSSVIEDLRHRFAAGVRSALPEPQASFGLGLLVGERSTLPKSVTDSLAAVGLTHIIAVSGYNLTIIVSAVRRLLSKRSKYQSTLIAFVLMAVFVLVTGFSASIVRAAIVSTLSIMAWYYGRSFRPVLLIALTAAVTALWNPLYVWTDAGWYLSFLAFFGVLVLAPLINQRLPGANRRGILGMIVVESACAQIMTAPYILYMFKQLSLIALPSNMIIVPLVPIAMLLSLVAGLAGMFFATFAGWVAWPARILLTYILDLAALFARVPHAVMQRSLTILGLTILYAALALLTVALARKVTHRGTITDVNSTKL